jgi:hypothetical protein
MISLAWAAGFLEGEGSFCSHVASLTVSAVQVQREPLDRLQVIFGGSIKPYVNNHGRLYYKWAIHGSYAIGVAYTMYAFLSLKRREQVQRMIMTWKRRPGRNNSLKTHCPHGHEYTPDNIYRNGGRRSCKECYRLFPHNGRNAPTR